MRITKKVLFYAELEEFFDLFESDLLEKAESDFIKLTMIYEVYRKYEKGNESLFYTLKQTILEHFEDVTIPQLL